jgi:hypothetical protein
MAVSLLCLAGCAEARPETPPQMAQMDDTQFCGAVADIVRSHPDDWTGAMQQEVDQRYTRRGLVCLPTARYAAPQVPAPKQASPPQRKLSAAELRQAEQQRVFERLLADARQETALNAQHQAEYQAAVMQAKRQARSDAAFDALIGLGVGLMATQPARPTVPRVIDCSVTPGSFGRTVSCW